MTIHYNKFKDIVSKHKPGEHIYIDGSLDLSGCTSLTSLPDNLTVNGSLDLIGCTGLKSLPDNLAVNGSLSLSG